MPPSEVKERFTGLDYALLQDRYIERPFGDERYQIAKLAAQLHNENGFGDPDRQAETAADHLPKIVIENPTPPREQPVDEAIENVKTLCKALGGFKRV